MPSYSPELIQTRRAALEEVMTKIPVDQATPRIKAHMAKFILKAAAEGQTSYERLLASASDKISASETLIRYLGPSEAYFWLSNQNSWKHFVVAAQIKGETTTASWRTALDAVQRRHPLLGVCIDADDSGAPFFRLLPELRIPLRIVPEDALQGWEDEMETELSTPFPVEDALLVRAVLLHKAHRATILLTVHHSIADGLSVALIVRDILEALSGKPLEALPVRQPQEELCPPPTIQSTELGSEEPEAPGPRSAPGPP